jgi:hypothetical protein
MSKNIIGIQKRIEGDIQDSKQRRLSWAHDAYHRGLNYAETRSRRPPALLDRAKRQHHP